MVTFWYRVAAYGTWAVSGLPGLIRVLDGRLPPERAIVWLVAFPAFAAAFALCGREADAGRRRLAWPLFAVQTASALALVWAARDGLPAAMLVITAAGLPHAFATPVVIAWVAAQSVALAAIFWALFGPVAAVASGGAFTGFQLFAVSASWLALSESRARMDLARTNAELTATRGLLAENSRVAERLRIARDLHDTLGHHLTALSLQLEVASRLTDGPASPHIREAHAVAKLLLADVRDVVGAMRGSSGRVDVTQALRALTSAPGPPRIHLELPDRLDIDDAARADALLRCVQEIITNAARHSSARNLWIAITRRPDGIDLQARDDGRGVTEVQWGNGLRGMRERFEEYAGRVEFRSAPGRGFEVRGFMPRPEAA